MAFMDTENAITSRLASILNLPLTIARDAGNMKNFQFGAIRPHPSGKGTVGGFALHIQCPWRIVATDHIITGSTDHYQPPSEGADVNEDDPLHGNLQRLHLRQLLGGYDPETRSLINEQNRLVVEAVHADRYGGIGLDLSGGFRLEVFPDGTDAEDWRFFSPGDEDHFVVAGGQIISGG